ncbi:MAG TPA: methyltransferase domain-containing protein [Dehalococcoidia bacterium]|nr:methyltransferase domain-containing protein [Dehalococcoidia bacterium]
MKNLLQTPGEWAARNQALARSMRRLIAAHAPVASRNGIDIGCQDGRLVDGLSALTGLSWCGVDPAIASGKPSPDGFPMLHGWAHELPFGDGAFDCAVLANVYEHIAPELRLASLTEIRRVLRPGGLLVGQLPNPYFPIESHSRLPFMGWLPAAWQRPYWRLAPVEWEHDFYVVTIADLKRRARRAGFAPVEIRRYHYPSSVIPARLRPSYRRFSGLINAIPWAWQFAFRRA